MTHTRNNLTALRWLAAGLVLYGHAFTFMGLPAPLFMGWMPLGPLGVYIFFSISGYLIAQSWDSDPNMLRFLARRALRIFPGLIVVTALSVFVLGPAFTTLPLREYFSHKYTWGYFTNIFLFMTYRLPGVFAANTYPDAVNGSLWSLTTEFAQYLVLMLMGLLRVPRAGALALAVLLLLLSKFWAMATPDMLVVYRTDLRQMVICGVYFWVGATFCRFRLQSLFTISNVFIAIIVWLSLSRWPTLFAVAGMVMMPFLTLAFGMATGSFLSRLTQWDYSYGIYIYAFPIQQALASIWPKAGGGGFWAVPERPG